MAIRRQEQPTQQAQQIQAEVQITAPPIYVPPPGFESVIERPRHCICVGYGKTGAGKTFFALSETPDPIALINYDDRDRQTVLQVQDSPYNRRIARKYISYAVNKGMNDAAVKAEATRALNETQTAADSACQLAREGKMKSIVFDTGDVLGDIIWTQLTGTLDDVKDAYGKLAGAMKSTIRRMMHQCRNAGLHVIVLAREKEVWKPGKASEGGGPTGIYLPRINEAFLESADFVIEVREHKKQRFDEPLTWEIQVQNAKIRKGEQGRVYQQGEWEGLGAFRFAAMLQGYEIE